MSLRPLPFLPWLRANRVLLNVRLGDKHLQVWAWGARIIPAETGPSAWRVDQVLHLSRRSA